jgi:hypothetical protein
LGTCGKGAVGAGTVGSGTAASAPPGVAGVWFAANFGLKCRVPSGPVIVTESAAISCTR